MQSFGLVYWIFLSFIVALIFFIDIGFTKEKRSELEGIVNLKGAIFRSVLWMLFALSFGCILYYTAGYDYFIDFITAYILEWSLSVDNLFVFILVFGYLQIPRKYQHRVLLFGILGAVFLRLLLIYCSAYLVNRFDWIFYFFAAIDLAVYYINMLFP